MPSGTEYKLHLVKCSIFLIRTGGPDGPISIASAIVQIHVRRATIRAIVAIATHESDVGETQKAQFVSLIFIFVLSF